MPSRSLSVIENAVPCSIRSSETREKRERIRQAPPPPPPPRREHPDGPEPIEAYPVEPGVVEDVGAALVEHDGAVALRRHVLPRVLGGQEEEAAQSVGDEGSPEIPRDGRHPRAGGCFPGRLSGRWWCTRAYGGVEP